MVTVPTVLGQPSAAPPGDAHRRDTSHLHRRRRPLESGRTTTTGRAMATGLRPSSCSDRHDSSSGQADGLVRPRGRHGPDGRVDVLGVTGAAGSGRARRRNGPSTRPWRSFASTTRSATAHCWSAGRLWMRAEWSPMTLATTTCVEIKILRRVRLNHRASSTPSTRRLLDGVAMPVPHRSTEPGRPTRRAG